MTEIRIAFDDLKQTMFDILRKQGFDKDRSELCARVFAENSRDGVYSHGINRFPVFLESVRKNLIHPTANPEVIEKKGLIERWDGHLAPGMYTASLAMQKAIDLAKERGLGLVAVRNTNHWMRGGTYGLMAAEQGCIGICATNAIANMPAWGGTQPSLGNNPLVIAIPHDPVPVVLDMALSQFSYGKLQEHELDGKFLPVPGGFDEEGKLTMDAAAIRRSQRPLPIGFWKGSGLAMMIDILVAGLSGGRTVADITGSGEESGVSQLFLCIHSPSFRSEVVEQVISFSKQQGREVRFPGEAMARKRKENLEKGIPVHEEIWARIQAANN